MAKIRSRIFGARQNSHSHPQPYRCDRSALRTGLGKRITFDQGQKRYPKEPFGDKDFAELSGGNFWCDLHQKKLFIGAVRANFLALGFFFGSWFEGVSCSFLHFSGTQKRGLLEGGFCKNVGLSWLWRSLCQTHCWGQYPWVFFVPWAWHWTLQKPRLLKPPFLGSWILAGGGGGGVGRGGGGIKFSFFEFSP